MKSEYGDICASRHLGNAQSVIANTRVNKKRQIELILELLRQKNMTPLECAKALDVPAHTISGRFKGLRENGLAFRTGVSREGSAEHEYIPQQMSLI